jgi:hypothetical protein
MVKSADIRGTTHVIRWREAGHVAIRYAGSCERITARHPSAFRRRPPDGQTAALSLWGAACILRTQAKNRAPGAPALRAVLWGGYRCGGKSAEWNFPSPGIALRGGSSHATEGRSKTFASTPSRIATFHRGRSCACRKLRARRRDLARFRVCCTAPFAEQDPRTVTADRRVLPGRRRIRVKRDHVHAAPPASIRRDLFHQW